MTSISVTRRIVNGLIALSISALLGACSELILPETGGTADNLRIEDAISVSEALQMKAEGQTVTVLGYYVGFIEGTNISQAVMWDSPTKVNTNILLADYRNEEEYLLCLPVALPQGTMRDTLNLYENKDQYRKHLLVKGKLGTYFKMNGITKLQNVKIVDDDITVANEPDTDAQPPRTNTFPMILNTGDVRRAR